MLIIHREPVQSVAFLSVLKYDPAQAREPAGSPHGGEFAKQQRAAMHAAAAADKTPSPTWARRGEVAALTDAITKYARSQLPEKYRNPPPDNPQNYAYPKWTYQVRSQIKEGTQSALTERLKDHPAFADLSEGDVSLWVKSKIDLWAETAGDHQSEAIRLQDAVRLEFGLSDGAMNHMGGPPEHRDMQELARMRAFVRAEYDRTQEWFKARGITHVSVFRGMGNEVGGRGEPPVELGHSDVQMQPASSWSTDIDVAIEFGGEQFQGVLLTTRVPIADVLSTSVTGRGCLAENEIILMGRPQRARVFDLSGKGVDPEDYYNEEGQYSHVNMVTAWKQRILDTLV